MDLPYRRGPSSEASRAAESSIEAQRSDIDELYDIPEIDDLHFNDRGVSADEMHPDPEVMDVGQTLLE